MKHLGNYRDFGQAAAEVHARLSAHLDARGSAAHLAGRHGASEFGSPFRRPNYALLSSVLAALLLAISGAAQAASIDARSPSFADVSTAVAAAAKGDTVIVPAGTAS